MDYKRQFVIPFGGLKLGHHQFDFEIGDKFFAALDYSEIRNGSLKVELKLEKQPRMLQLVFDISGSVEVICDRCLDPVDCPVNGTNVLFVKFGKEYEEESEDVIVIPETQTQLDVMHYIYEFISLLMPYRHVHPEDKNGKSSCDPHVIKKLEELTPSQSIDSRWDALKNIEID
ncbi:MAG: DUF177 domain-containing protein [Bacteroidales bacterium]|nr:DUF177 domain-containing protein [Bacteroidales bacterium]MDZ4203306.1 DUF177 domain-containing protein [Bacteroidales bacterium]